MHAPLHRAWTSLVEPATLVRATGSTVLGLLLFWMFATLLSSAVAFASYELFEKRLLQLKDSLPGLRSDPRSASQ